MTSTQKPNPTHVLVLDLETTDSNPFLEHAAILELGAILCKWDLDLTEVARAEMLIRPDGDRQDHEIMWQNLPPVVREMHVKSGLWAEATTSDQAWGQAEADSAFGHWLLDKVDGPIPVVGSGVGHLDLPFVHRFMPATSTRLTYWPIDSGNVRRALQLAGRDDLVDLVTDVDAKPHRALGDAELHLNELRRYLQLLSRIPVEVATDGARL